MKKSNSIRNKFLVTLIVFLPYLGTCQHKSSLEIIGGAHYSYRTIFSFSNNDMTDFTISSRNKRELPNIHYRFGLAYSKQLKPKLYLKSGLIFSDLGYKDKKQTGLLSESEILKGMKDPTLPHEIQHFYSYRFIEIPISIRKEMNMKKLFPYIELGLSPSIFLHYKIKQVTDLKSSSNYYGSSKIGFNKVHLVTSISAGLNHNLNQYFQIFGQASYRMNVNPLVKAPIKEFLFSGGIETDIRFKLQ